MPEGRGEVCPCLLAAEAAAETARWRRNEWEQAASQNRRILGAQLSQDRRGWGWRGDGRQHEWSVPTWVRTLPLCVSCSRFVSSLPHSALVLLLSARMLEAWPPSSLRFLDLVKASHCQMWNSSYHTELDPVRCEGGIQDLLFFALGITAFLISQQVPQPDRSW